MKTLAIIMDLLKAYELETESQYDARYFSRGLFEFIRGAKILERITERPADAAIEAEVTERTSFRSEYDLGSDLNMIYIERDTTRKGQPAQRRFFRRNIPAIPSLIEITSVFEGTTEGFSKLESYLASSAFKIKLAYDVSTMWFSFSTAPSAPDQIKSFAKIVKGVGERQYPEVEAQLEISDAVEWAGKVGSTCVGILTGPVKPVFSLGNVIFGAGDSYGIEMARRAIEFLK